MPLKVDDLLTLEAYKKAIKAEATRIASNGATKFWIYRDVELPTAAGKKQKLPLFIALVDNRAILPLLRGKKLACTGTVGLENGKVAFDPVQGQIPYKQLKTSAPLLLGKQLHVPGNVNSDTEDDEEEKDGGEEGLHHGPVGVPVANAKDPGPTPPPAGLPTGSETDYAQLNAAWHGLVQKVREQVAADPAKQSQFSTAMAGVPELLRSGRLDEARKRMAALHHLLTAPAVPSNHTDGGTAQASIQPLTEQWSRMLPHIKNAVAVDPSRRAEFTEAAQKIAGLLRAGSAKEAQAAMQALAARLRTNVPASPRNEAQNPDREGAAIHPRLAQYRHFLGQFAQARSVISAQIDALTRKIKADLPHESEFAEDLAFGLEKLSQELARAIDEAISAAKNETSPVSDAVRQKLGRYATGLASHQLVQRVDTNPLGVTVTIAKTLGEALGRIRESMPV
jgi:hypothetical protein